MLQEVIEHVHLYKICHIRMTDLSEQAVWTACSPALPSATTEAQDLDGIQGMIEMKGRDKSLLPSQAQPPSSSNCIMTKQAQDAAASWILVAVLAVLPFKLACRETGHWAPDPPRAHLLELPACQAVLD